MPLRPNERTDARRNKYKVAVDSEEGRRRREDNMVEIRKTRREESLQKKRREGMQELGIPVEVINGADLKASFETLPSLVASVWSDDTSKQLEATTEFRKRLSMERSPPIQEVIEAGVVPRFVELLTREDHPKLQFEAAWALTNIASGTSDHTKVVIDHGAIPIFVKLLGCPNEDVREQAVWALGNVAGDSPKCRDLVLNHGALGPLLALLNEHASLSMLRNATWTLSNFCRGKPQPMFEQTRRALPILRQLIHSTDEEVLADACWALSYLSDGTNDKIEAVIDSGSCPRLTELLLHPSASVVIPALRTIGNIVTGDDMQTQAVIDANIISPLIHLLEHAEFDVKKEAAWTISNATSGGSHEQIKYLVNQGCIKPLCDLLVCPDPRIVTVSLEGLDNILKVGESDKTLGLTGDVNVYAQLIDEAEGVDKIETLQSHDNNEIYEKAVKILETYWGEEDDDSEQVPPPGVTSQQGFQFGAATATTPSGGFNFN